MEKRISNAKTIAAFFAATVAISAVTIACFAVATDRLIASIKTDDADDDSWSIDESEFDLA